MANLTQLKMLEDLNGFLLVDKPEGMAFSTIVKTIKRKFNLVKVGHGGSLDTMASGLFVVLIGDANQFVDRVMGADREYEGELKFGATTNTGDRFGAEVASVVTEWKLEDFKGDVFQTEPRFAAIRKEGAADYEVVDTGEHGQFLGHVYRFELDGGKFALKATKNVIPRAMAIEMGATLMSIRRISQGKFKVSEAVPFAKVLECEARDLPNMVMPLSKALA